MSHLTKIYAVCKSAIFVTGSLRVNRIYHQSLMQTSVSEAALSSLMRILLETRFKVYRVSGIIH